MKTSLKLAALAAIAIAVAAADAAIAVHHAEAAQLTALNQFNSSDDSARTLRAERHTRPIVERLIWLAVPASAVALFAGDFARFVTGRN